MSDFEALIDADRLAKARANFDNLVAAERAAEEELSSAKAGARAAHAAAQDGADRGENAKTMDALEIAADAAERRTRTAGRLLEAAAKKREAGERVRDAEVKQAHGAAMNAAFARFIGVRSEALQVFAKLKALEAEHIAVRAEFLAMANASKSGAPNLVEARAHLLDSRGELMSEAEAANRLNQNQHHEWDNARSSLRWVE
jgi:hypothetical protein